MSTEKTFPILQVTHIIEGGYHHTTEKRISGYILPIIKATTRSLPTDFKQKKGEAKSLPFFKNTI